MVLVGILFVFWRIVEIITLTPPLGMLGWFVHGFVANNALTPNIILVLFIVVTLAFVWAVLSLLFYAMARHNGFFLAFVDLCFVVALIAGVYELRGITDENCSSFNFNSGFYFELGPFTYSITKTCAMLKASFAFAIMNIFFFFFTFLLAIWVRHHHRHDNPDVRTESYSRSSRRRSSRAGSRTRDRPSYRASSRQRSSSRRSAV